MDEQLQIAVRPEGSSVVLTVAGEIDLATCDTLRTCIDSVGDGFETIVVDVKEVTFIDSSGLNVLLASANAQAALGRHVALRDPIEAVRRVLDVAGISQIIPVLS